MKSNWLELAAEEHKNGDDYLETGRLIKKAYIAGAKALLRYARENSMEFNTSINSHDVVLISLLKEFCGEE